MLNKCVLTVGQKKGDFVGKTNSAIQAAVDEAARLGGGTVVIMPGKYIMNDSLHLRSGVTVKGSGEETVLWKPDSQESQVIYFLGYGHYDVSVAEPEKFSIGTGIYITDDRAPGFHSTVATVSWKQGHELGLTRALNSDVHPWLNGIAVTVYPIISACYIQDCCISNLVIDGNAAGNRYINGCRGGGVYMLQAHNADIKNVVVKNFNGDGISFQQCKHTLIEGCKCINNTGNGLHPGSGSVGTVIRETECSGNGADGIFYCLRVSYAMCESCIIENNGNDGISIGHRDTDSIIRGNRIAGNGRHGIYFRQDTLSMTGHRTLIDGNHFEENCCKKGRGEIFFDSTTCDVHILNNSFRKGVLGKEANSSIYLNSSQNGLILYNNSDGEGLIVESDKDEQKSGISFDRPSKDLEVGPGYIHETAFSHLNLYV